jgi:hypothetical protein
MSSATSAELTVRRLRVEEVEGAALLAPRPAS